MDIPLNSTRRVFVASVGSPTKASGGMPFTDTGALSIASATPTGFGNGYGFQGGKLAVNISEVALTNVVASGGQLFKNTGELCLNFTLPIASYNGCGWPIAANGSVCASTTA